MPAEWWGFCFSMSENLIWMKKNWLFRWRKLLPERCFRVNSHKCLRIIIRTEGTLQNRCELSVEQESFFYVQAQKEGTVPSPDDGAAPSFLIIFRRFYSSIFRIPAASIRCAEDTVSERVVRMHSYSTAFPATDVVSAFEIIYFMTPTRRYEAHDIHHTLCHTLVILTQQTQQLQHLHLHKRI